MAKGKPSDSEDYIIRSGVRSGLKREFAFALKSQAELSPSLGRTRSGKPSPSPCTNPNPNSPRSIRYTKRFKKSSSSNTLVSSIPPPWSVLIGNGADTELRPPIPDPSTITKGEGAGSGPMEEEEPEPVVENPVPAPLADDRALGGSEADSGSSKVVSFALSVAEAIDGPKVEDNDQKEDSGGSVIDMALDVTSAVDSCALQSEAVSHIPIEKPTDSVFTTPSVQFAAISVETPLGTENVIIENPEGSVFTTPAQVASHSVQTPVKTENIIMERPTRRFTRSLLKTSENAEEGSQIEIPTVVNEDRGRPKDGCSLLEKPTRRFTRSLLKAPEDTTSGEASATVSGGSVGSDEMKGVTNVDVESSSFTLSKKLELKMSKKIALNKLPTNVRDLLGTGLLEGLPVKYFSSVGKPYGLEGVIMGNGILCSCSLCKGSKVVSSYNFEVHAGSTKKHPSEFIFLENGKSLRDVMRACTSSPLNMLEAAIQGAVGALPITNSSTCRKCKRVFHTPRAGKFALMCDSCLESKQNKTIKRASQGTPSTFKLRIKGSAAESSYGTSKMTSLAVEASHGPYKKTSFASEASYGPSKKASSQKKSILAGDSDNMSKNSSFQKKVGKLTRKDLGLHKLVFMDDILPEGTEVGYYVCGKRLLEGYIKDSGIFCLCCNTVVSPSQFEAHAGRASRRKPYNNIYTSNGVSLHELSVSLSKGRKLSASENDDLCSICADGGNLLLCDLCPRAFHKECVGLSSIPRGDWYCRYCQDMHQREKCCSSNDNAIAAGRVAGVDPIEQIIKRCIRIVTTSTDIGGCVLCRCHDFSTSTFDNRTVIICDQCEKEYHVGCLKGHNMCDLKELPEGEWFCSSSCSRIHTALQDLLHESRPLEGVHADIIKKKHEEKGLNKDDGNNVRWRLLSGKTSPAEVKLLLSEAVTIFHESFDPIVDAVTGRDLIPSMVYGRNVRDQDFGGMYCAVLTVNSSVVSAGILRVLGCEVAELPLVATQMGSQGLGYFQSLFSCIEKLFESLQVKHFVLPSAEEAKSIWTKKFGFSTLTSDQLRAYTKGAHPIIFQGTTMLHKPVNISQGSG